MSYVIIESRTSTIRIFNCFVIQQIKKYIIQVEQSEALQFKTLTYLSEQAVGFFKKNSGCGD